MTWNEDTGHHPITLEANGNKMFGVGVLLLLSFLEKMLPERYREAITYLPHVRYTPHQDAWGWSDGTFSIEMLPPDRIPPYMSGYNEEEESRKADEAQYRFFYVYLHEVGHNLCGQQRGDWSEEAANEYAEMVLAELGMKQPY